MSARIISMRISALAMTIVFASIAAAAQTVFPPRLSVENAVDKVLAQDPRTRIADAAVRIADAGLSEARTGMKPVVQFSQNVIRSNNPVFVFGSRLEQGRFKATDFALDALNKPDGLFNFRTSLSVQQPLFDQRQTKSRVSQAEFEKQRAELQTESIRQNLRFETIRNYFGVVLAREMLDVSDRAVRSAEANVKKAKDMVEVGMTTDADYLAAEVEAANANQQKLEAESGVITSVAALNIALGERPDLEMDYTTDLVERIFTIEPRNELLRLAFENRPDYRRAELSLEAARAKTRGVRDQKLPQINAFGSFGYSSPYIANGSTDYTVGLNLTYTLFDAGRKSRVEQAAGFEAVAENEIQSLSNQIRLEVIRAEQDFKTSRARIQVSVKAIEQANEALRIVQDRYKFGLTTFNEVLRAESALVRSKHNLLSARYGYYLSYASVLLATGRLLNASGF